MKKQEGITLVALVITIIIMLILVGVTVTLVLDSGLLEKAKTAANRTNEETLNEQAVVARRNLYYK